MAMTRAFSRSFAGGEISPEMFGRLDDAAYQSGLALCKNFLVTPQGPVENRPGFQFVREVKDSSKAVRLIPFTYSSEQTLILAMGDEYFRFFTQGAWLLYTNPAPAYNAGTTYAPGDNVSYSGVNYTAIKASLAQQPDISPLSWYPLPADSTYEIPHPYAEADLFDVHYVQSGDVMTLVHPDYAPITLNRAGAENWYTEAIDFNLTPFAPVSVAVAKTGTGTGYPFKDAYVVTAVGANGEESEASPPNSAVLDSDLAVAGTYHDITWAITAPPSAIATVRYNVYKRQGGIYGFIGSCPVAVATIRDDNIAPDLSKVPPVYDTTLDTPAAVSYFEQRKAFAGTPTKPQTIWMTKTGAEDLLSYSLPVRDDDRIQFRIAAREFNAIRHIVPLNELILLSSSTEWRVTSVNEDALTPTSVAVRPQSYIGSSNVQPVIVNNNLIFGAARGGHLRELAYDWKANGYLTGDLSLRATHLFDNLTIVDMAYSKAPTPILWFVSSNGKLLGFTYVPEQRVGAWHQHDTVDGTFESVAVVAEGDEDVLYVVVRRLVDGSYVRYVERIASRFYTTRKDAFFVDSGLSYDGANIGADTMTLTTATTWALGEELTLTASAAATFAAGDVGDFIRVTEAGVEYSLDITAYVSGTEVKVHTDKAIPVALQGVATTSWAFSRYTFTGISHLESETVSVLADGGVAPQQVVTGGEVTLPAPAVRVHIGLPITADIQTLPMFTQADSALAQGRVKNVNRAWIRVYLSSGTWIGPSTDRLVEAKPRTTEAYGSPPNLVSQEIDVTLKAAWTESGQVYIRQVDPLPLTVAAFTFEVSIGG